MYIDPVNLRIFANELKHYGVLGMKWGIRKKEDTKGTTKKTTKSSTDDLEVDTIRRDKPTPRKKKVTEGNGMGAHKRGEGQHVENAYGEEGVGPWDSFHNATNVYGADGLGQAPVSMQLGRELRSAVLKEIIPTEEFKNIKKLTEELEKMAEERKKTWNQGSTAVAMVFEEKASKLIREINSNLTALDNNFAKYSKLVKQTADKSYSPSKDVLDFLSPSSSALNIDKKTGRVSKGWKSSPTTPKNSTGYKL